jgi:hypothetical protein
MEDMYFFLCSIDKLSFPSILVFSFLLMSTDDELPDLILGSTM